MTTTTAAVVALLTAAGPAYANGGATDGPVGVGVIGSGLTVREVRVTLDGWWPGDNFATAEIWRGGQYAETIGARTITTPRRAGRVRYEIASWTMRRTLRQGDRVCAHVDGWAVERPCATIHR